MAASLRTGETLGKRMRRVRESVGISRESLAATFGRHPGTIKAIEDDGMAFLSFEMGVVTAHVLGVSPWFLVYGVEEPAR